MLFRTNVFKMKGIFRLVVFVDDDLADVVALHPERKVDVQVGVAEDNFEMLDAALKKPETLRQIFNLHQRKRCKENFRFCITCDVQNLKFHEKSNQIQYHVDLPSQNWKVIMMYTHQNTSVFIIYCIIMLYVCTTDDQYKHISQITCDILLKQMSCVTTLGS